MEPLIAGYHHADGSAIMKAGRLAYFYRSRRRPRLAGPGIALPAKQCARSFPNRRSGCISVDRPQLGRRPLEAQYLLRAARRHLHAGRNIRRAIIGHLPELAALGITTIELMPIGQFPGSRNWGYDGVYPFAPQNTYGGPEALQKISERGPPTRPRGRTRRGLQPSRAGRQLP